MDYFEQYRIIHEKHTSESKKLHEKYNCNHVITNIKKREIKGGAFQYVMQCSTCGKNIGQAIAKKEAFHLNNGLEPPPFDNDLFTSCSDKQEAEFKAHRDHFHDEYEKLAKIFGVSDKHDRERFFDIYERHLKTEKWKKIREKVFKRANNICEGCMDREPVVAHHLTYSNVGDELLFQLVALCQECHDKCHN